MKLGTRLSIVGMTLLLVLAGCGRGFFQFEERAAWRHEAEVACLKSGDVALGTGVVQIKPIEGPGICGADFPLKVAALGEYKPRLSYADDPRPPGLIADPRSLMPQWPVNEPRTTAPSAQMPPIERGNMRWTSGPPGISSPHAAVPSQSNRQPLSISPPGVAPANESAIVERSLGGGRFEPVSNRRVSGAPRQESQTLQPRDPARSPMSVPGTAPAALTPPATLACPIVSALDRWVSEGVQPAALHWFGMPVTTISQISAYSCRDMVGSGTSTISEHAFGNALDIAGFTLADGRTITVKDGWHGMPEEQGFLHDVQLYACETFTTVLAPGYNVYHDNHIHVDLMRRASGRHPCRPDAVRGEIVAAKARAHYANRRLSPPYTGSMRARGLALLPQTAAGEDGYVADDDKDRSYAVKRR